MILKCIIGVFLFLEVRKMQRKCDCCGCNLEKENEMFFIEESVLCEDCYDDETRSCDCCGTRIWNDNDYGDENLILCLHCREDYVECEECGRLIHENDAYYFDDDYPYCLGCYDRISERKIHSYNYKPEPVFYGDDSLYMGVELEIDEGGKSESNAEILYNTANSTAPHIYIKHDGSINYGMEIVTHPMTLEYHINSMPWQKLVSKAIQLDYRSHKTNTCGLHVHVNRNFFSNTRSEQDECISRVLFIVERFWEELLIFSRRTKQQLQRWASRYGIKSNPKEILESALRKERYTCVNLCNYDTIEFRIFRGTLKYNTIIATLQLVKRICMIAKNASDEDITDLSWPKFVEDISEQELITYLKERRLYINDKVEETEEY